MISLRNLGPQLHLFMKILQERPSLADESSLLKMRLLHRLTQAWKLTFSHLLSHLPPGGGTDGSSQPGLIYHISPCQSRTCHISQKKRVL